MGSAPPLLLPFRLRGFLAVVKQHRRALQRFVHRVVVILTINILRADAWREGYGRKRTMTGESAAEQEEDARREQGREGRRM